jgi:GTP-binding protein
MAKTPPLVAIVGRPNVGKSRLFNRFLGERRSIVDDTPGVTRDRIIGRVETSLPLGRFLLCDTGGFEPHQGDNIKQSLVRQATFAIDEARLVLFVVDGREGLHPVDEELARMLRKSGRPFLVVVNKCDIGSGIIDLASFRRLGVDAGRLLAISAEHNLGFDELECAMAAALGRKLADQPESPSAAPILYADDMAVPVKPAIDLIRLAIVGRPNVGKSSLLNALLGEERSIVDPRPGTTRDVVDATINAFGKSFQVLDTAGIRRKSRVSDRFETYSIVRSLGQIEDCDIAALVIDAAEGPTEGDVRVAGLAFERRIPLIIVVNKWDLITNKETSTQEKYKQKVLDSLRYVAYAPVLFCSAAHNFRVSRLLQIASQLRDESNTRVSTSQVNQALEQILQKHTPPLTKSRSGRIKFYYATQVEVSPPRFVIFCSHAEDIHFSYKRFVENELRSHFGFKHIPLAVHFRTRERAPRESTTNQGHRSHP